MPKVCVNIAEDEVSPRISLKVGYIIPHSLCRRKLKIASPSLSVRRFTLHISGFL
ncbi:hypothetical protein HYR99_26900 [Candidatus Poribacteria bacterium]|nr:hypothetical protein [Candidatus Poribacteria bacterium]